MPPSSPRRAVALAVILSLGASACSMSTTLKRTELDQLQAGPIRYDVSNEIPVDEETTVELVAPDDFDLLTTATTPTRVVLLPRNQRGAAKSAGFELLPEMRGPFEIRPYGGDAVIVDGEQKARTVRVGDIDHVKVHHPNHGNTVALVVLCVIGGGALIAGATATVVGLRGLGSIR